MVCDQTCKVMLFKKKKNYIWRFFFAPGSRSHYVVDVVVTRFERPASGWGHGNRRMTDEWVVGVWLLAPVKGFQAISDGAVTSMRVTGNAVAAFISVNISSRLLMPIRYPSSWLPTTHSDVWLIRMSGGRTSVFAKSISHMLAFLLSCTNRSELPITCGDGRRYNNNNYYTNNNAQHEWFI